MKLTIITINYKNLTGLQKTMDSVLTQTYTAFEYIVVDGGSGDKTAQYLTKQAEAFTAKGIDYHWVSEPDKGIYNAMNKGIRMATGEYIQILNSADCLAANDVTERMLTALEQAGNPSILYGNMLKVSKKGIRRDRCFAGQEITFMGFYTGTLNHDPAYIRRDLFEKYGYYDEDLKIVSDWKWYMQAIVLGEEKPQYVDIDVTLFDMYGVSETNLTLRDEEKRKGLEEMIPTTILADYDRYAFPMDQMRRLQRHPWAYKLVWFLERVLFKFEKWTSKEQIYK